ncbi:rab-GTPase-TBC domain-containing protein [Mycena metata]|uniref:Rab-GTPase-TBC domain-containing protein n=1 Tax=Mycena metata TaxID=1033252 RepID=A0AAD7NH20_9AGAR|nr:rab-GTPase-TBC domain-containing protein [Mycena metata]
MASEKASPELDDWEEYRRMSLAPGGFGDKRADVWCRLVHAEPQEPRQPADEASSLHPDERQIRLDTERSFVLYPVDSKTDKETLQSELHDLLVEIFRKRPKLNYFQGYHDIITVLLLTLPPELQLPVAEQLSLQRVRDSMGHTLEPVLGLLRVMKNLIRAADPQYAELLERTSPLPYYALPNLLTLFSHDMPTLPLIQHVFDYLLCRPPIFVVYLASTIILSRKQDVQRLEEEGEEGMMHSILSALPEIVEENSAGDILTKEEAPSEDSLPEIKQDPSDDSHLSTEDLSPTHHDDVAAELNGDHSVSQHDPVVPAMDILEPTDIKDEDETDQPSSPTTEPKLEPSPSEPLDSSIEEPDSVPQSNRRKVPRPKPYTLTEILNMADALYQNHPPTDPSLQVSSIMGPQSVVFTWSTHPSDMPSSDEAERMVDHLELIVYPEPPVVESKEKSTTKRQPKRLKRRKGAGTVGLLVGAGLVLGVAVAVSVYGARQGGDHTRDWRKLGRWVGGVLAGASERVIRYRT